MSLPSLVMVAVTGSGEGALLPLTFFINNKH